MAKINDALYKIALPVCERNGVYIYDTEYKKEGSEYYLRLYIDKDGGVTIDDCEKVSRELNPLLDDITLLKDAYIFEVSSPGIDRFLSQDWHFEKVMGEEIEIKLFAPINGTKELCGILTDYSDGKITILSGEDKITIEKNQAATARLAFKF